MLIINLLHSLLHILVTNTSLNSWLGRDAVDPLHQMREGLHVLLTYTAELVALDPWP